MICQIFYRMPETKGKKRKAKGNWHNQYVKKRKFALCPDLKGFLLFCNNKEKETIREAYVLLNQFADQMYGPEKSTTIVSHTKTLNKLRVNQYNWGSQFEALRLIKLSSLFQASENERMKSA